MLHYGDISPGERIRIFSRSEEVRHDYWGASDLEIRASCYVPFVGKVLEVYRHFVLVEFKRGKHKHKECFLYQECEKL